MIQLGRRTAPVELVASLEECHVRIRRFLETARRIADTDAPPAELAARRHRFRSDGRCDARAPSPRSRSTSPGDRSSRYFREALPQHVADEHLLAERLVGHETALDAVLETMRTEHASHEAPIARLLDACAAIERAPETIDAIRPSLAKIVSELEQLFLSHLELEERELFPALQRLDVAERHQLHAEIRARRTDRERHEGINAASRPRVS